MFLGIAGKSFALPACQGNDESKWQNCEGTLRSGSGKVFLGEFKDGKFIGTHAKTGNKYVGEFKDNQFHGQGTYTFASGTKYVGEHRNGKANGQGTYTFADGTVQEGIWADGRLLSSDTESPALTPTALDAFTFLRWGDRQATSDPFPMSGRCRWRLRTACNWRKGRFFDGANMQIARAVIGVLGGGKGQSLSV